MFPYKLKEFIELLNKEILLNSLLSDEIPLESIWSSNDLKKQTIKIL
jgi:hypothetical protein